VRGGGVALLGTTMSPGFEFADYEHGERGELVACFPRWGERIGELTPGSA
jgi:predicted cupin superfamily sugar epimerase